MMTVSKQTGPGEVATMYRFKAKKRNLRNLEPEARVASGGFLIAKISHLSI